MRNLGKSIYFCSVLLIYYIMIDIKNVSFSYKKRGRIFSNFSLSLSDGMVCGLLGRNGTGKSTLLNIVSGLLFPSAGSVTCRGVDVCVRRPEILADMLLVPEDLYFPDLTSGEYVAALSPFYGKFSMEDWNRYLQMFELPAACRIKDLSMGQRKKLYISFALATNAAVLLMDEPTNGLDIPSKSQFRRAISSYMSDDRCVVISTHQVGDVENLLDHVVILEENRVLLNSSTRDIARKVSFVASGVAPAGAFYSQPTVGGMMSVAPAADGVETDVNLELLFNGMVSSPEMVKLLNEKEG